MEPEAIGVVISAGAAAIAALASLISLAISLRSRAAQRDQLDASAGALREIERTLSLVNRTLEGTQRSLATLTQHAAAASAVSQQHFETSSQQLEALRRELGQNRENVERRLDIVREAIDRQLTAIRADNTQQLEQMRATVDEKLSRTLNDRLATSFKQVSAQLEAVYKGLGDMQSIAAGVGDLKRVLSNVKTRGMLGEVQLGAILAEILAPEQYLENVACRPGSSERVEFAVKLPRENADPVLLPIDAKFPGDTYEHLRSALEGGDADAIATARRALEARIKSEARDIQVKYISVPETTNFALLFLPFEGLYAEVVDRPGLVESLQRDYHVTVAGPSTMAAILNSLQITYQTFRLQKRTDDVLRVLAAVKAELPHYQEALRRARKQIDTAGRTVDSIITTRTNVIARKLSGISALDDDQAPEVLGLEVPLDTPEPEESEE